MATTAPKTQKTKVATSEKYIMLVLGMHRSGTSALGGVLHHLGCALPSTLMPVTAENPKGYFESTAIMGFNDTLLRDANSSWNDWRPLSPNWIASVEGRSRLTDAAELLEREFGAAPLVLMKDPRICRILAFWLEAAGMAGYRVLPVLTHRHPLEVAKSLQTRDGIELAEGLLLWLRHAIEAEAGTRGMPRFMTSYGTLLRNWVEIASGIQDELGVKLPRFDDISAARIDAFLSRELRHFEERPERIVDNPTVSNWIRETYEILERWARDGEDKADWPKLDQIRVQFDAAVPLFGQLVDLPDNPGRTTLRAERDKEAARAAALEQSWRETQAELDGTKVALEKAERTAAERTAEINALGETLEALRNDLHQSQSALAERQLEADQASAKAEAERTAEIEALGKTLEALRNDLHQSQSALVQRRLEADQASARADAATAELDLVKVALERARAEAAEAEERLVAEQEDARSRIVDLEQLAGRLTALLERAEQSVQRKEEELAAVGRVVIEAREALGEAERQAAEDLQRAMAEAQDVQAHLEHQIAALRGSTSWKLTAPIRAVVNLLRRKGRKSH